MPLVAGAPGPAGSGAPGSEQGKQAVMAKKNAGLGERLARLEQSQEMARVNARASEEDTTAALTVSRHGVRCNRLQESCKTDRT